jgi:hypothetical protein
MVSPHKSDNVHGSITDLETNAVPINAAAPAEALTTEPTTCMKFRRCGATSQFRTQNNQDTRKKASIAAQMPNQTSDIDG